MDAPGAVSTDEGLVEIKLHRDFVLNKEQQDQLNALIQADEGGAARFAATIRLDGACIAANAYDHISNGRLEMRKAR
jgi:hypothetical protein